MCMFTFLDLNLEKLNSLPKFIKHGIHIQIRLIILIIFHVDQSSYKNCINLSCSNSYILQIKDVPLFITCILANT